MIKTFHQMVMSTEPHWLADIQGISLAIVKINACNTIRSLIQNNNHEQFVNITYFTLSQNIIMLAIILCQTIDKIKQDYINLSNG